MAGETVQQFLERLSNDASLRAQLQATGMAKADAILDFATMNGFVFTEKELRTALKDYPSSPIIDRMRDTLRISYTPSPTA